MMIVAGDDDCVCVYANAYVRESEYKSCDEAVALQSATFTRDAD